jgi:hypothetical protein
MICSRENPHVLCYRCTLCDSLHFENESNGLYETHLLYMAQGGPFKVDPAKYPEPDRRIIRYSKQNRDDLPQGEQGGGEPYSMRRWYHW